ncbi:peptidyl-prolyl cis-trans isomerase [Bacillus carboniphilus]|uniref:Peptidyl-prolyl cis-trans isomerase n=1 Tax=Bacillus carboniphilus TaxID=86663 RepID=A0ABY9JYR5_9BACI|nr:peptidyl-prolyl cis-trans isomerase [Bacillus carboniphilus]WLR43663.1 peptidyl-prolyl cis-trans isomerase [Bacillus carboniphilus]
MSDIIQIKGSVQFEITLDPSTWIFDDRKVDLSTCFQDQNNLDEIQFETELYRPPTAKSEQKFQKEKILTGSFAIPLAPFLKNSEPKSSATFVSFQTNDEKITIPIHDAEKILLAFSKDGKPLKDDGPVHVYYKDGSNQHSPIKRVDGIIIS